MRELIQTLIHFRNTDHEFWFYGSMIVLVICVVIYFIFKSRFQFLNIANGHLVIFAIATIKMIFLKQESEVFSVDCVWFNGLMCTIYLTLFFSTKFVEKKLKRVHL